MENLSSYYQSQGQALPSVQQRQGVASQAGIQNYSGTAQQNTQLLNFLKTQQTPQAQQQNAVPVSSNIPANIIGTQQVQIPQAQPIQAQPVENIASTLIEQTKTEATPLQGTQENLISKILENQLGLQGEAQAQADANLQAGVNTKIAELNDLNSKILQKQAEVQQDDITLVSQMRKEETRDTLLPFAQMGQAKLAGDAQIVRALKNAEIGVLNAQAIGKQGDVQLARDTAKQAVELKFAPYKERIALYQSQLEAIAPLLSREEKAQAREQDIKTKLALSKIDKLETFQSKALENAISNNAPQSVISKILNANSIEGITSVGGNYLVSKADKLEQQLKSLQINKLSNEIATTALSKGVSAKDLPLILKSAEDKIGKIQGLIDNKKGLTASSGVVLRKAAFSDKIRDWRADVQNVLSDLTVDELGRVKASGVTFGALSEGERKAVGDAASALNAAARTNAEGKLTGYFNISEDKVRKELQTIQDYAKIDFERRTGVSYDDYVSSKNQQPTEQSYADGLLNNATTSPFSIFN